MLTQILPSELSGLDRTAFVSALSGVYEHSDWVAERAWDTRPFANRNALFAALDHAMLSASPDLQHMLIRAHPELAGVAASAGQLSLASTQEQQEAGLVTLGHAAQTRMQVLNARYRETFGFPFIIAVRGRTPEQIADELEQRLQQQPAEEFATALQQIALIAGFRLAARVADAG
ncbi:2-oxo-4-hydroxy-4-carboxy-5-ureidoimidazoline decarboxylase [Craterilacuibacter sp.]|uniref:2-oxo-4-hydroxy-4-carboxy-5-ureidoimidazoline decarboxylase n=1 Tax=Craterilacuibacter sp. TaxID=2870909 RepID=UPI003F3DA243